MPLFFFLFIFKNSVDIVFRVLYSSTCKTEGGERHEG